MTTAPVPRPGHRFPTLRHRLTAAEVAATSTAVRELRPVHLDAELARRAGLPDVILGTTAQQLWLQRAITGWLGPLAHLRRLDLRMRAPVTPGPLAVDGEVRGRTGDELEVALTITAGDVVATTAVAVVVALR